MKKIGIIAEYNPFHNGHLYHIEKIKERYPDSILILILSGNFSQRGIPSMMSKWEKTKIALTYGVDLVVELPFVFATQSADIFASASITLLKELGVEILIFGSEENDPEKLKRLAEIQMMHPEYERLVKVYLEKGENYPTAMNLALKELTQEEVTMPNDLLGLSYVKEIQRQKANIKVETIKRTNAYHDADSKETIASATAIRMAFQKGWDIKAQVPKETLLSLEKQSVTLEDYFPLLRYKIYASSDLKQYLGVDEGLEYRIQKNIISATSYQDLIEKIKSKRYTYSRVSRLLLAILCDFTKEKKANFPKVSYIRVLGFRKRGQQVLKEQKKKTSLPIYTTFQKQEPGFLLELKVTKIYASTLPQQQQVTLIKQEYQQKPIMMEDSVQ